MQPSYTQKLTVERIFITSDLVWSWFKLFGKGAWDMWWRMSAMHSALDTSSYTAIFIGQAQIFRRS